MQICGSLCQGQTDLHRKNAVTPLSTLRSNAAKLKCNSTYFPQESFDAISICVTESKLFERLRCDYECKH